MRIRSWSRASVQVCVLLCALAAPAVVSAAAPRASIPENADARISMKDTIFAPVRQAASAPRRLIEQPGGAGTVIFQTAVQDGALFLVFEPQGGSVSSLARAGTFIIKRSMKDGSFLQAKVFLQSDPGCFIRIAPASGGARALMSLSLFGETLQKDIIVPASFQGLLTSPVSRLMDLTASAVDWPLALPAARTRGDERLTRIVAEIRRRLPRLGDAEDGAMDRDGSLVFIADGRPQKGTGAGGFNCSGFAKWVIDGFYGPLAGALTDIDMLKERGLSARGNRWSAPREEERDPYFGLDWSRNLARSLEQARTGELQPVEAMDVGDVDLFPYVEDVGYPVESLRTILSILSRREPGTFYLGSVNSSPGPGAGPGGLRQHHHVVVLFPYVDQAGLFRSVVMERNVESTVDSLAARYPGSSVHLVRVSSEGDLVLPSVE
jgi:hypothetical protein